MARFWVFLWCALWLHASAWADPAEQAWTAAGADAATTAVGLSAGLVELNPLGPVGAIALKAVVMGYIQGQPEEARPQMYNFVSSLWGGAAANNLCWLVGAGPVCMLVGALTGNLLWNSSEQERQTALARKPKTEPSQAQAVLDVQTERAATQLPPTTSLQASSP